MSVQTMSGQTISAQPARTIEIDTTSVGIIEFDVDDAG
jgi:hypothetical protein